MLESRDVSKNECDSLKRQCIESNDLKTGLTYDSYGLIADDHGEADEICASDQPVKQHHRFYFFILGYNSLIVFFMTMSRIEYFGDLIKNELFTYYTIFACNLSIPLSYVAVRMLEQNSKIFSTSRVIQISLVMANIIYVGLIAVAIRSTFAQLTTMFGCAMGVIFSVSLYVFQTSAVTVLSHYTTESVKYYNIGSSVCGVVVGLIRIFCNVGFTHEIYKLAVEISAGLASMMLGIFLQEKIAKTHYYSLKVSGIKGDSGVFRNNGGLMEIYKKTKPQCWKLLLSVTLTYITIPAMFYDFKPDQISLTTWVAIINISANSFEAVGRLFKISKSFEWLFSWLGILITVFINVFITYVYFIIDPDSKKSRISLVTTYTLVGLMAVGGLKNGSATTYLINEGLGSDGKLTIMNYSILLGYALSSILSLIIASAKISTANFKYLFKILT